MSHEPYIYTFEVQDSMLDEFSHMNHVQYFSVLEKARWQILLDHGYDREHIRRTALAPVVIDSRCRFRQEIRPGASMKVLTHVRRQREMAVVFAHEMRDQKSDALHFSGDFVVVLMHLAERRMVRPTENFMKICTNKEASESSRSRTVIP